jgi:hypothetical protein
MHMQQITRLVTGMMLLAAILITWQATAKADLLQIEDGIELHTADVYWDGLRTGRLTLRRCASCQPSIVRLDAATRYSIEGIGSFSDAREFPGTARRGWGSRRNHRNFRRPGDRPGPAHNPGTGNRELRTVHALQYDLRPRHREPRARQSRLACDSAG